MKIRMICAGTLLVAAVALKPAGATQVRVRVVDSETQQGIAKALVIVMSLEPGVDDVCRDLTRPDGSIPDLDVPPGLYEAIASYPYGALHARAHDFLAGTKPVAISLEIHRESGGLVIGSPVFDLRVQVLDDQGRPVPDARIIGRDLEGYQLAFGTTDKHGRASVRIPADGAEVTTIYGELYHVDQIKLGSDYTDCCLKCSSSGTHELSKGRHDLTVRLK